MRCRSRKPRTATSNRSAPPSTRWRPWPSEAQDPTKSATDLTNYTAEFNALARYIGSVTGQKFNSVDLFSATALSVPTGGGTTFSMTGIDLNDRHGAPGH